MNAQTPISKSFLAAGLYSILGVLPSMVAIFTLPIYLKHLSVVDYGALALLQFYGNFFGMVVSLQLNAGASITFFDHARDIKALDQFKSTIFTSTVLISCLNFVLFLLIGHFFFNEFLSNAQVTFQKEGLMVMGNAVFSQIIAIHLLYQRNEYKLRSYLVYTLASLFLTVLFQYFLIVERQMGITGSVFGNLIANLIIVIFLLFSNTKLLNLNINRSYLTPTLKLAIPLIPLVFLEWFFSAGTRLFVEKMMTLEDVGKVSLLVTFMVITNKLFSSIWSGYSPELLRLLKTQDQNSHSRINHLISTYLRLGLMVLSGTLMLGCNLSLLTENPKFLEIVPLIPIASLALLPKMLTSIPTLRLMYEKKSKLISVIMTFATVTLITGFVIIIPRFGLAGILYVFLIANLINYLIRSWQCRKFCLQVLFTLPKLRFIGSVCILAISTLLLTSTFKLSIGLFGISQFTAILIYLCYISRKELASTWSSIKLAIRTFWIQVSQKIPR